MQCLVDEQTEFERDALRNAQPMQVVANQWRHVVILAATKMTRTAKSSRVRLVQLGHYIIIYNGKSSTSLLLKIKARCLSLN